MAASPTIQESPPVRPTPVTGKGADGEIAPVLRDPLIALFLIGAATFLLYSQVLSHFFLAYDDPFFVTENRYVQQGLVRESIFWSFTATLGFYHPITWLSLMLDATFFGLRPGAFHLTNLWLHIANTVLLFSFLRSATGEVGKSLMVAALFAWHPVNVETVAWVSERKGLLAMFFALLALIAYVNYARKPSIFRMAVVALAMLLSLLCKASAVVLPVLLLALDYWPLRRLSLDRIDATAWRKGIRLMAEKLPLFFLALVFTLLTIRAESNVGALRSVADFPLSERALNSIAAIPLYLRQIFFPGMHTVYVPSQIWSPFQLLVFISMVVFLVWLTIRSLRARGPLAFGIIWFLIALAPVLGFVKIGTHLIADRYLYLAEIGFFVAVVWTVASWDWIRVRHGQMLFGAAGLALMFLTHRQVPAWKDDLALGLNGARAGERNAVVCYGLGVGYDQAGEREQSLRHFREVLEHHFDYASIHYNIARAYVIGGRPKRALVHLDQAQRGLPYEPRYLSLRAEVLAASHDPAVRDGARAVEHAALACRLSNNRESLFLDTLAAAHAEAGDFARAVAVGRRAKQFAASREIQELIESRLSLYAEGKPFRGTILHQPALERR